jgi:hypothetical protein
MYGVLGVVDLCIKGCRITVQVKANITVNTSHTKQLKSITTTDKASPNNMASSTTENPMLLIQSESSKKFSNVMKSSI